MKSLTIILPDMAYKGGQKLAEKNNIDFPSYCSAVLSDRFLEARTRMATPTARNETPQKREDSPSEQSSSAFSVEDLFPGFPRNSIRFAQEFVDAVLDLPPPSGFKEVRPYKKGRGIGFDPNFVFIEYLMSRGGSAGIGVSFYGGRNRHNSPPDTLHDGIPSYSRAKIRSDEDLKKIIPHIRQAYELKYGKIPE